MNAINFYITLEEFDTYIKSKLDEETREKFSDCTWVPLRINNNNADMSIDVMAVPVKN